MAAPFAGLFPVFRVAPFAGLAVLALMSAAVHGTYMLLRRFMTIRKPEDEDQFIIPMLAQA